MRVTLRTKRPSKPITRNDPPASWAASQTGPRQQNEDDYGRADQDTPGYDWEHRGCLYLLADGMGGLDAGKEAAQAAVRQVTQEYRNIGRSQDVVQNLTQAMQNANQHLYRAGTRSGKPMGSTMVACILKDGKATIAHAGDSRAYHLANGELRRLTKDHLYATEVLGIKDDDEAKRSPEGHKITRALGKDPDLKVDIREEEYRPGDRFLLCSDGISEALSEEEIAEGLSQKTPEKAVRALCFTSEGRLSDNATAVVVFASGKKIRRQKQFKRLAYSAAAVVLLGGVSAGIYEIFQRLPGHEVVASAQNPPASPTPALTATSQMHPAPDSEVISNAGSPPIARRSPVSVVTPTSPVWRTTAPTPPVRPPAQATPLPNAPAVPAASASPSPNPTATPVPPVAAPPVQASTPPSASPVPAASASPYPKLAATPAPPVAAPPASATPPASRTPVLTAAANPPKPVVAATPDEKTGKSASVNPAGATMLHVVNNTTRAVQFWGDTNKEFKSTIAPGPPKDFPYSNWTKRPESICWKSRSILHPNGEKCVKIKDNQAVINDKDEEKAEVK